MIVTAEIPLIVSAIGLATATLLLAVPRRLLPGRDVIALVIVTLTAFAPIVLYPLREVSREAGRALWEWSAVGGPTVQASYRFDGLAALGMSLAVAYCGAGLLASRLAGTQHQTLPSVVLATGFTFTALAVTDNLIAATVLLGLLAALTASATLLVAPAPATARLAAYLTVGIQCFVVAALLISRFGGASFQFAAIQPTELSPGIIVVASLGAALFAGVYPFVPWRFEPAARVAAEREPLRGLLAMPAGVGATLVLLRLLGVTEGDLSEIPLPALAAEARAVAAAALVGIGGLAAGRASRRAGPLLVVGTLLAGVVVYPALHWSHLVLAGALLSILYAAAVSLALPEQWEVVRHDVTLAALWIGLAVGTPIAIVGALFVVAADAATAVVEASWMPPHRSFIAVVTVATMLVAGVLAVGVGVGDAPDPAVRTLAVVSLVALLTLELIHIGRRLSVAEVPTELDLAATGAAFLSVLLLAVLLATPLQAAVSDTFGRPFPGQSAPSPFSVPALAVTATLLVVLARSLRPLIPDLAPLAASLRAVLAASDPVPAGVAAFRLLESTVTRATGLFALFERRAGVWLATALITALLAWAVR